MPGKLQITRTHAILRLQRQLEYESYPRLQMMGIVALTGLAGMLCSFLLLRAGLDSMALRYPLALGFAYLIFLLQLWIWLRTRDTHFDGSIDAFDLPGADVAGRPVGGGGHFGGGGASGAYDEPATGSDLPTLADADEFAIPLVVIALVLGLALACLYLVWLAPALFAELLVDGVLSYTLYRRLRTAQSSHWLGTALSRTAIPFGITAIFLAISGAAMTAYAPGARSIGEVVHPERRDIAESAGGDPDGREVYTRNFTINRN